MGAGSIRFAQRDEAPLGISISAAPGGSDDLVGRRRRTPRKRAAGSAGYTGNEPGQTDPEHEPTTEMINAGVRELLPLASPFTAGNFAADVYRAMERVRVKS